MVEGPLKSLHVIRHSQPTKMRVVQQTEIGIQASRTKTWFSPAHRRPKGEFADRKHRSPPAWGRPLPCFRSSSWSLVARRLSLMWRGREAGRPGGGAELPRACRVVECDDEERQAFCDDDDRSYHRTKQRNATHCTELSAQAATRKAIARYLETRMHTRPNIYVIASNSDSIRERADGCL